MRSQGSDWMPNTAFYRGQLIAKRELLEAIWPHVVVEGEQPQSGDFGAAARARRDRRRAPLHRHSSGA
jgi:hypothetical protein